VIRPAMAPAGHRFVRRTSRSKDGQRVDGVRRSICAGLAGLEQHDEDIADRDRVGGRRQGAQGCDGPASPVRARRPAGILVQLGPEPRLGPLEGLMSKKTWLGVAERIVFKAFQDCASYVSPFSIHNPEGWRYWFIHFANSYRARQEYNNVLHQNSSMQAHFGRSGLHMLSYDPTNDSNMLYLFDVPGRSGAKDQLSEDIPRLVTDFGDTVRVQEFYESIYNMTPAHMDDVHLAIIENPDLQVITPAGGERRKANTIGADDILRMRDQRSFFPMFLGDQGPKIK